MPATSAHQEASLRSQLDSLRSASLVSHAIATVEDDDLEWLSNDLQMLEQARVGTAKERLKAAMETEMELRLTFGSLRSSTRRREDKLHQLDEELYLLEKAASATPAQTREKARDSSALAETESRVAAMEAKAASAMSYHDSLEFMHDRLIRLKQGSEEAVRALKLAGEEVEEQVRRRRLQQKATSHAAWQDRNAAELNLQLFAAQVQTRTNLKRQRRKLIEHSAAEEQRREAEQKAAAKALAERGRKLGARSNAKQASWMLMDGEASGRLARLEEQFLRVSDLMGFSGLDDAVARCYEQVEARVRMAQSNEEAKRRHDALTEEKAQAESAYEEMMGGVDSELFKRRAEYDQMVEADTVRTKEIERKRGRCDAMQHLLAQAQAGVTQLAARIAAARRGAVVQRGRGASDDWLGEEDAAPTPERTESSSALRLSFAERVGKMDLEMTQALRLCETELVRLLEGMGQMQVWMWGCACAGSGGGKVAGWVRSSWSPTCCSAHAPLTCTTPMSSAPALATVSPTHLDPPSLPQRTHTQPAPMRGAPRPPRAQIHTHTHTHTRTHAHAHTRTRAHARTRTHAHARTRTHTHTRARSPAHAHTCRCDRAPRQAVPPRPWLSATTVDRACSRTLSFHLLRRSSTAHVG